MRSCQTTFTSSSGHLILRSRPDVVATSDNREVARRWLMICPERRSADLKPLPPNEAEINSIANCPVKCQEIRKRLSNFSWWMRLLCQRVAQRANNEEKERGRFFQDRYGATRLTDEASLFVNWRPKQYQPLAPQTVPVGEIEGTLASVVPFDLSLFGSRPGWRFGTV